MKAEDLMREAQEYSDKITEYRRTLHKNAETGFDLKNTVAFVKEELEKALDNPINSMSLNEIAECKKKIRENSLRVYNGIWNTCLSNNRNII